jgi:hypothetical protein
MAGIHREAADRGALPTKKLAANGRFPHATSWRRPSTSCAACATAQSCWWASPAPCIAPSSPRSVSSISKAHECGLHLTLSPLQGRSRRQAGHRGTLRSARCAHCAGGWGRRDRRGPVVRRLWIPLRQGGNPEARPLPRGRQQHDRPGTVARIVQARELRINLSEVFEERLREPHAARSAGSPRTAPL